MTLNSGFSKAWTGITTGDNVKVQIEKEGQLVGLNANLGAPAINTAGVSEGDYISVLPATTPPASVLSPFNTGIFKIVKLDANTVWIENPNAVEQTTNAVS